MSEPLRHHRGSCIGPRYELRITRRCLVDDLELASDASFELAYSRRPIVGAFQSQRLADPRGTRTVGPEAGAQTFYRLGLGHDHRGATWHDTTEGVVWLCAYSLHRSGEPDDAFKYFPSLIAAGTMLPDAADYDALFSDRAHRFVDTLADDARSLLSAARAEPGLEHRGIVGGELPTGVIVEIVETLEETCIALSGELLDAERIVLVLAAFYPDAEFTDWEFMAALPHRALKRNEVACRILRHLAV